MVVALPVEAEALPVEVEGLVVPAVEVPEVETPAKVKECPAAPEAVNLAEGQAEGQAEVNLAEGQAEGQAEVNLAEGQAEVELVAARAVAENNAPCS